MKNLKKKFENYKPYINGYKNMKRASVLIPLVKENNSYSILFQLRSKTMSHQPGEICFPGGKIEANETPLEACIRETCEEIGACEADIEIISPLDIYVSHANLIIHPFVGYVKNYENLKINKSEVDHIFLVPINYLLSYDATCYTNDVKVIPNKSFPYDKIPHKDKYKFAEGEYPVWFYEYKDYVIWGITARILENFLGFIRE